MGNYQWPTLDQWVAMSPDERRHRALRYLREAVRNEHRGADSPAALGQMSFAVQQALHLADNAIGIVGPPPGGGVVMGPVRRLVQAWRRRKQPTPDVSTLATLDIIVRANVAQAQAANQRGRKQTGSESAPGEPAL